MAYRLYSVYTVYSDKTQDDIIRLHPSAERALSLSLCRSLTASESSLALF